MKKIYVLALAALFTANIWSQCENYTVALASITQLGGPTVIEWTLTDLETQDLVASGSATFNMMTYSSQTVVCLEPGCYSLDLVANGIFTQNVSGGTILLNGALVPSTNDLQYGTQVFSYDICTETQPVTCNAEISIWEQLNACEYIFQNNSTTEADGFISWQWTVDGEPAGEDDGFETAFGSDGVHEVCLFMVVYQEEIPVCYGTDCLEIEVEGCGEGGNCPEEIWSSANGGCGTTVQFEIGSFAEGEAVNWWFGDSDVQIEGGHFITHTYDEPGIYNVCAFYTSYDCPDGVELCTEIVVEECDGECVSELSALNLGCGNFQFDLYAIDYTTNIYWNFGDGSDIVVAGFEIGHTYLEPGVYEVSATWAGPNCGEQSESIMLVVELCNECDGEIAVNYNCPEGLVYFYVAGWAEGTDVNWYVNDYAISTSSNWLIWEIGNGGWVNICAWTADCPEICQEIYVQDCGPDCNMEISIMNDGCEILILQASGIPDNAVVHWLLDGEQVNEGWITTFFLEPGANQICAWYEFEDCVDEWCETFYGCGQGDCPEMIWSAAGNGCGEMIFEIGNYVPGESVVWYPGDESGADESGHFWTHTYAEPGYYTVCAWYTSSLCPNGVELCTEIYVQPCDGENDCPEYIEAEQIDCNSFLFHVAGVEGGQVQWGFGDGSGEFSTWPSADHSYESDGIYIVTAYYTSDQCEGVYLVYTVYVDCENFEGCPDELWSGAAEECGLMLFEIGSFVQGESVTWYPGDDSGAVEGGHFWSHEYEEPGLYTVCAFYTSPLCEEGVELCTTIIVESCGGGGDCPNEMWHSENDCGHFQFEVNSAEGESVDWYVNEDLVEENGGHFWQHQFEMEGWSTVCAFFTSNDCPDGVWLCTQVYSDLCGGQCSEVNFSLDSFVEDDGPLWVSWHLFNGEGIFIADGIAQYSANDPWYDWAECLPDGCYSMYICAPGEFNGEAFDVLFGGAWDVVSITPIINEECFGYNVILSLNSDCGQGSDDCQAWFEPAYGENGWVEFDNNSEWVGEANFVWSYGNGSSSDGMNGAILYTENGEYEVCLTITTSEGCYDTYCETIVIDSFDEDCDGTEIMLQINTNYPEPGSDNWTVTITLNEEELGTFPFITCYECPEEITLPPLCVEDGCYTIAFNSEFGVNAEEIIIAAFLLGNEIPLGDVTVNYNDETAEFQVGINDDCVDGIAEDFGALISVFPNPANDVLNIRNISGEPLLAKIYDCTGRMVVENLLSGQLSTLNTVQLSNGLYTMQLMGKTYSAIRQFEIAR